MIVEEKELQKQVSAVAMNWQKKGKQEQSNQQDDKAEKSLLRLQNKRKDRE